MSEPYIGRPLRRSEDAKLVTGHGQYVEDITVPGLAHLVFLRSPHAHARVTAFAIVGEINRAGVTVLLVEQNTRQALALSRRGYVLESGRVVLVGTGEDLLGNEHVRRAYLGL